MGVCVCVCVCGGGGGLIASLMDFQSNPFLNISIVHIVRTRL